MTETALRHTYGLISGTIITTLAKEGVNDNKIYIFSLYMQWGIILGYPGSLLQKKALAMAILQWLKTEIKPETLVPVPDELDKLCADNKDLLHEIYDNTRQAHVTPKLDWYHAWEQHCAALLLETPSFECSCSLLLILKDSLKLKFEALYASVTLIDDTLRQALILIL